ncbi:MAG: hypothetical protein KJ574_03635 [Nanoarchaeota archaeon]|nr:hypothetical protein [Nanoarchaeota archaeon]
MGVEYYLATAESLNLSTEETAAFLLECAWRADKMAGDARRRLPPAGQREMNVDSLECRIMAALLFEDLKNPRETARALDWAGKSAYFLDWLKYKADLKQRAAAIYEQNGDGLYAGYNYLNAADALMTKSNRQAYIERIDDLMSRGIALLKRFPQSTNAGFIDGIIERYSAFQEKMSAEVKVG